MGALITKATYRDAAAEAVDKDEYFSNNNLVQFVPIFKKLGIRDADAVQLHIVFQRIDIDNSGSLSVKEFFNFFELQWVTPMSRRVFTLFDADNSGELDFGEFSACAWNYLSLNDNGLLYFIFDVYDSDESGRMCYEEFKTMMLEGYGHRRRMPQNVISTMKRVEQENAKEFMDWTKLQFVQFVGKQRSSFWPLFTLQAEMRLKILGLNFWLAVIKRRASKFDPTVGGGMVKHNVVSYMKEQVFGIVDKPGSKGALRKEKAREANEIEAKRRSSMPKRFDRFEAIIIPVSEGSAVRDFAAEEHERAVMRYRERLRREEQAAIQREMDEEMEKLKKSAAALGGL